MAQIFLVRHAKAGERRVWAGDDIERPLSKLGRKQAALVGKRLAEFKPTKVLSSPYTRCIQTVEPLGARIGVDVEIEQKLCEDEPFEPVLKLISSVPNRTVMCSHGDIIPPVLAALERRGTEIRTPPDWRKASVWVLKRNKKGQIVNATVWPPPRV